MTDTPSERVWQARQRVSAEAFHPTPIFRDYEAALDALIAAVRAEERAQLRSLVEMRVFRGVATEIGEGYNSAMREVLALLSDETPE